MENLNFKPTRDWLVVPKPDKKVTDAGIILSDKSASALRSNVLPVLAAGPDCKCNAGDVVYIHPASEGVIINIDDNEYVMINESMAVLGVVTN
jgi:co-chaperonin GroES (HSP10)